MSALKTYRFEGSAFIPEVLADHDFKRDGYIVGVDGDIHYAVMDPARHPLDLWRKKGRSDYEATAKALGSVAFTNGPQMDRVSKTKIIITTIFGAVVGAGFGFVAGIGLWGSVLGGAAVLGYWGFSQWTPFGRVTAPSFGTDPGKGYTNWAWFGVTVPTDFNSYQIGEQGAPPALPYVSGGLTALVINFVARSGSPNSPVFNAGYGGLGVTAGIAAWGLVPILPPPPEPAASPYVTEPSDEPPEITSAGVLVAAAGTTVNSIMAGRFASIGAEAAVAMDGSASAMFGTGSEVAVPNPRPVSWFARQTLQRYGFYCH